MEMVRKQFKHRDHFLTHIEQYDVTFLVVCAFVQDPNIAFENIFLATSLFQVI